ncbi:MAG: type II toxin-antitoxin system death-on-curing family toxin [Cyanobacteria bacterium NC_groundwater_1444_Ag_S-0.65um_54_12]|nr:type II toxin-antitoxin system death-on-curing family toxin [Cyanobacteria bacterium NC_groundwater_1444_Ag_S-0.65um_54_12]
MIHYLEVAEVIAIQDQMIDYFGGEYGLRGEQGRALVESALARPLNRAAYEDADLLGQAAALFYGLAKNHGFLDGNKRIAVAATNTFLLMNGYELTGDNETLVEFTIGCGYEGWTEERVEEFVRLRAAASRE